MRILLVDDDTELVDMLTHALRRRGHTIVGVTTAEEALESWERTAPSLVVLDVGMPVTGGLELCRIIREKSEVPILLMSGACTEDDVIKGLQAGADDYVFKPFSIVQLALRIDAIGRRARVSAANDYESALQIADLVINPEYCSVKKAGRDIRLTRMEFRILYCLAANAGRVVVTDKLADFAWQGDGEGDPALLKTHISRIRRKVGLDKGSGGSIEALPGLGYSLTLS
jgi:DNA-binding response OmpR family regulator